MYKIRLTYEYSAGGLTTKEVSVKASSAELAISQAKEEFYSILTSRGKIPDGRLTVDKVIHEKA